MFGSDRQGGRSVKNRPTESTHTVVIAAVAGLPVDRPDRTVQLTLQRSVCLWMKCRLLEVKNAEPARGPKCCVKMSVSVAWNDRIQERTSPLKYQQHWFVSVTRFSKQFFSEHLIILIIICVWYCHCLSAKIFCVSIVYTLHIFTPDPLHSPLTHWTWWNRNETHYLFAIDWLPILCKCVKITMCLPNFKKEKPSHPSFEVRNHTNVIFHIIFLFNISNQFNWIAHFMILWKQMRDNYKFQMHQNHADKLIMSTD